MSSRLFTINLLFLILFFLQISVQDNKKENQFVRSLFLYYTIVCISLECMTKFQLEIGLTLYCFDIYNALQSINKLCIKM